MALESATPVRLATSVAREMSSGSNRRPGPSKNVMTPITSPLAVKGTASAVASPSPAPPVAADAIGRSWVRPVR